MTCRSRLSARKTNGGCLSPCCCCCPDSPSPGLFIAGVVWSSYPPIPGSKVKWEFQSEPGDSNQQTQASLLSRTCSVEQVYLFLDRVSSDIQTAHVTSDIIRNLLFHQRPVYWKMIFLSWYPGPSARHCLLQAWHSSRQSSRDVWEEDVDVANRRHDGIVVAWTAFGTRLFLMICAAAAANSSAQSTNSARDPLTPKSGRS